jgi:hypothetical protein
MISNNSGKSVSLSLDDYLNNTVISREAMSGYQPSIEELERMDQYRRDRELREAEYREKMEALKTFFPRGHAVIPNFDIIIDIARENQLNPLYEQVLEEFEKAQSALHRSANKLASAVKLTDSEEIERRAKSTDLDSIFKKMSLNNSYGWLPSSNFNSIQTTGLINGMPNLSNSPKSSISKNSSDDEKNQTKPIQTKSGIMNWLKGLIL